MTAMGVPIGTDAPPCTRMWVSTPRRRLPCPWRPCRVSITASTSENLIALVLAPLAEDAFLYGSGSSRCRQEPGIGWTRTAELSRGRWVKVAVAVLAFLSARVP